jgi:hypothetical protein
MIVGDNGGDFLVGPEVGLAIWFAIVFVIMLAAIVVVVWAIRRDRHTGD